jgi:hypothetical protein
MPIPLTSSISLVLLESQQQLLCLDEEVGKASVLLGSVEGDLQGTLPMPRPGGAAPLEVVAELDKHQARAGLDGQEATTLGFLFVLERVEELRAQVK